MAMAIGISGKETLHIRQEGLSHLVCIGRQRKAFFLCSRGRGLHVGSGTRHRCPQSTPCPQGRSVRQELVPVDERNIIVDHDLAYASEASAGLVELDRQFVCNISLSHERDKFGCSYHVVCTLHPKDHRVLA